MIILMVYIRKHFRNISMFRYYSILVFLEMFQILTIWPYNYREFFQFNKNSFSCKLIEYLTFLIAQCKSLISVIIAIDRYVSIKYTNKFQIRKKLSFQITVVLILFVVSSVLYTPWLIFSDIFTKSNNLTL